MWGRIVKVLKEKKRSNPKIILILYKVIVISTLVLYGSESWVVRENEWRKLRSFHNRCVRFITGSHITQIDGI